MLLWCFAAAEAVRGQAGGATTGQADYGARCRKLGVRRLARPSWRVLQSELMMLLLLSSLTHAGGAVPGVEARRAFVLTRLGEELCAGRVHVHFD